MIRGDLRAASCPVIAVAVHISFRRIHLRRLVDVLLICILRRISEGIRHCEHPAVSVTCIGGGAVPVIICEHAFLYQTASLIIDKLLLCSRIV